MDTTSRTLLAVGGVLALIVGIGVYLAVASAQRDNQRATVPVVVARQEIPDRTLFTGTNVGTLLATRLVPIDTVPADALSAPAAAIGKATTMRLVPNEIVLGSPDRLASGESGGGRPAATIPRDKVAVAVPATDPLSVGGAVQPGDRVDVIGTWQRGNEGAVSQTLFQDVRVFAVGSWRGDGRLAGGSERNAASASISLLLDPQEAVMLEYLLNSGGSVAFALRRFDQTGEVATEPITAETLTRRAFSPSGTTPRQ